MLLCYQPQPPHFLYCLCRRSLGECRVRRGPHTLLLSHDLIGKGSPWPSDGQTASFHLSYLVMVEPCVQVLKYCPVCHKVNNFYGLSSTWPATLQQKSDIMAARRDKIARRPCPYRHGDSVETSEDVCPYRHAGTSFVGVCTE